HVDLTTVPTQLGFWCSWSPFAWPQCWPWCWWMAVVLDHYSRRLMGFALFRKAPTSVEVRSCLGRAIGAAGTAPRYLVSDKGSQFFPTAVTRNGVGTVGSGHVSVLSATVAVLPFWNEPCGRSRKRCNGSWSPRGVKPC